MKNIFRIRVVVGDDFSVKVKKLPVKPGDKIEILLLRRLSKPKKKKYPLRGTSVKYIDPFESVAEKDWEILK